MDLNSKEIGAILNTTDAVVFRDGKFYDIDNNEVSVDSKKLIEANTLVFDVEKYTLKVSIDKIMTHKLELARQAIANLASRRVSTLGVNSQYSIYKSTHTAVTLDIYTYDFSDKQKEAILLDVTNGVFVSSLWDKLYLAVDNGTISSYEDIVELTNSIPTNVSDMNSTNYSEVLDSVQAT